MINLLKFKKRTDDGESGEEAYGKYMQAVAPLLAKVGGRLLWLGKTDQFLIGDEKNCWDRVMLIEYPSRQAFLEMTSSDAYKMVKDRRTSALENSALIASTTLSGSLGK